MKRTLRISIFLILLLNLVLPVSASSAIQVIIDGRVQTYDQPPTIKNGSTLVPLRGIFESLGATISWDSATQTVTGVKEDIVVKLTIGQSVAYKNNSEVKLSVAGEIINGRTMVPLRFVSEALGAQPNWDGNTRTITISSGSSASIKPSEDKKVEVKVTRVVDGDTFIVQYNGKEERVRMIGVDTPETVHPELGEQPFGKEASDYTKSRLNEKTVELEFDVQERDQYGRLLAYVWIGNEHFNATLLKEGYAVLSTWPPNVKYVDEYTTYQTQAREAKKGLWNVDDIAKQYRVGSYDINPDTKLPLKKVNINTATKEELQLIPGIGETLAVKITEYRKTTKFSKPEDLIKISGIGEKSFEKMEPYVTVE